MTSPIPSADLSISQEKLPDRAVGGRNCGGHFDREIQAGSGSKSVPCEASSCGHVVLDRALNVLAIDEKASGMDLLEGILTSSSFVGARQRLLDGEPVVQFTFAAPMPEGNQQTSPDVRESMCHIGLHQLDGAGGPLLLLTLSPASVSNPESQVLDSLTGVRDRRAVGDQLESWRRTAEPDSVRCAALFLDLNDFKSVNDCHGHAVGDVVLKTLAERWQECVRDGDLVARYGGDEFVLLLRDATTAGEVEPVIDRLQQATAKPVVVGDLTLSVTATIGWAAPEGHDWTVESLVAAADRDMYARKRQPSR